MYEANQGNYDPSTGCLELERVTGEPQVFVIGGGGSGIPVYRRLQRQGIPFAAGVIHENDVDYLIAKLLAMEVVSECGFTPIGEKAFQRAIEQIGICSKVICPLNIFGPMNEKNRVFRELAAQAKKLESIG